MRLILDLDGTLIDSAADIHAAVAAVLGEEGFAPLTLAEVRGFIGDGPVVLMRRVIGAAGADPARLEDWHAGFLRHYAAAPAALTTVSDGAVAALDRLRGEGWRLAICTNKPPAATAAVLAALGLDRLFDAVVAGPVEGRQKPAPEPLHLAAARLGTGPAVYVGDSEVDAAAAQAAGLPFGFYTGGYARAPAEPQAFRFDRFADLPGRLAAMLAAA